MTVIHELSPRHGLQSLRGDEPLGELALQIAKATDEKLDALGDVVRGLVTAVEVNAQVHAEEAAERAAEAAASRKRMVRGILGGSSAVTVAVALIGAWAQITVARTTAMGREQTREVASQTAQRGDGYAEQIAQRAAEIGYRRGLAERDREVAPLRVRPDASALARSQAVKESFE